MVVDENTSMRDGVVLNWSKRCAFLSWLMSGLMSCLMSGTGVKS